MGRKKLLVLAAAVALAAPASASLPVEPEATQALTPSAGQTLEAPVRKCSTFDQDTGFVIKQDEVTLVNPRVVDCRVGVLVGKEANGTYPDNVKILADPTRTGYDASGFYHTRTAVRVRGMEGLEVGGVKGGVLKFRNNYRNITFESGRNARFHHNDILGPSYVFPNGNGKVGSTVGIKGLAQYDQMVGANEVANVEVDHNTVSRVSEEGISADPGSGDAGAMVRETDTVSGRNVDYDWVELSDAAWVGSGSRYAGYFLVFNTGAARGKFLYINAHAGKRFNVHDPNSVLSSVAAGDSVSVSAIYRDLSFHHNTVDATGSRVGMSFGAAVFRSDMANNTVSGYADYDYPGKYNLRQNPSGVTVPQAIRVASQHGITGAGSVTGNTKGIPSAYNTVTGNWVDGALSFHCIRGSYPTRNYWADNVMRGTGVLWVHAHEKLAAPPA
jgi:hypothetical protein